MSTFAAERRREHRVSDRGIVLAHIGPHSPTVAARLASLQRTGTPPTAMCYLSDDAIRSVAAFLAGFAPDGFAQALDFLDTTPDVAAARRAHAAVTA